MLSVIVPANNEAGYIGACLEALAASRIEAGGSGPAVEVIVVANGCTDATAAVAEGWRGRIEARGWRLVVLDLPEGNKLRALNVGRAVATGPAFVYLDADILVSPDLLGQLGEALDRPGPAYASGRLVLAPAASRATRLYGRFWERLPFLSETVPGCGVFAINAAGHARWNRFPEIISDDTFVRLQFAPQERVAVPAPFQFPLPEGFRRLVRVRRRQDRGVAEIARDHPGLLANDDKPAMTPGRLLPLVLAEPLGFLVYAAVAVAVRLSPRGADVWARGR